MTRVIWSATSTSASPSSNRRCAVLSASTSASVKCRSSPVTSVKPRARQKRAVCANDIPDSSATSVAV